MPWHLSEFLLKGIYLGLLVVLALRNPNWQDVLMAGACMLAGLVLALGVEVAKKLRDGSRLKGRVLGFFLFLLLEHPRRVYGGSILGLGFGVLFPLFMEAEQNADNRDLIWYSVHVLAPLGGGAGLGMLFWILRHVRGKARTWLCLGLAMSFIGTAALLIFFQPDDQETQTRLHWLGRILLLGIPGFYLLTFAGLVEESEVEMSAMCGILGAGMWLLYGSSGSIPFGTVALIAPLLVYYFYTWFILPGLRVFKHALRGLSYARLGQFRLALASLNRALQLNPNHELSRQQVFYVHRQMNIEQLKNDPETLSLVNFDLCLERAAWLLLQDKPDTQHLDEAERLLQLIADQRPAMEPPCAYWRAVAALHRRKVEEAAADLEKVLKPQGEVLRTLGVSSGDSAQRRAILFQAWQLALMLHPEMKRRVGEPLLKEPDRRLEAIAAVERKLAGKADDNDAWDIKRLLYAGLTEADYSAVAGEGKITSEFDHAYAQQLGLALIEEGMRDEG